MTTTPDIRFLGHGKHEPNDDGRYCFWEAWCYLRDYDWSDHPVQASPVIAAFLRRWNDGLTEGKRDDTLIRYLLREFPPVDSETELRRSYLAFDWLIRTHLPTWLRLVPTLVDYANRIEALPEIIDQESAEAAGVLVAAARADAGPCAGVSSWDITGEAAQIAAQTGAVHYAAAVAQDAAEASRAAARAAAREPATAVDVLAPTVAVLHESAHQLIERMANIGRTAATDREHRLLYHTLAERPL